MTPKSHSITFLAIIAFGLSLVSVSLVFASQSEPSIVPLQLLQGTRTTDFFQEQVVKIHFLGRSQVDLITSYLEPWEINYSEGYLIASVDPAGYKWLQQNGFTFEVIPDLTAQLNAPQIYLPGQTSGIPNYPCYRTVEETYAAAQSLALSNPSLASWIDIGDSWEKATQNGLPGYDLMVLRLTNSNIPGPKPKIFIMSSEHAREYSPAELNTRFAEYLLSNYQVNPDVTWLLDYQEIHLLLQANPDGRKLAETGLSWRKNTNANYCPSTPGDRGADLNRNFSFEWGCCSGSSSNQCSEVYRGPFETSELETLAVQDYLINNFTDQRSPSLSAAAPLTTTGILIDLHSYGQKVLWSWGFRYTATPNGTSMQTLGRKLAYSNGYYPEQAIFLYTTDGTSDDYAYGELGLAAYTFEIGTSFFQDCAGFENQILPDNLKALLYAVKASRAPYLIPSGPEATDLNLTPNMVKAGEPVTLSVTIDDAQFNNINGIEPTQIISAAEYYMDTPPWVTNSSSPANRMAPLDGDLNESHEAMQAAIDTVALNFGRHMIFVRGQDSSGSWGAFSAIYLSITSENISFMPLIIR